MNFAAYMDKTGKHIFGLWRSEKPLPISAGDTVVVPIVEVEYQKLGLGLNFDGGGPRYESDEATLVVTERFDTRPLFRFDPTSISLEVKEPKGAFTMTKLLSGGAVDTGFNDTVKVPISDGKSVRAKFTNGVATIDVQTNRALRIEIKSNVDFRVEAPLLVLVEALDID